MTTSPLEFGNPKHVMLASPMFEGRPRSYWETRAKEAIDGAVEANRNRHYFQIEAAIDAAYPFGERKYHPYRIWCKVRRQMLGGIYNTMLRESSAVVVRCKDCGGWLMCAYEMHLSQAYLDEFGASIGKYLLEGHTMTRYAREDYTHTTRGDMCMCGEDAE